MSMTRTGLAAQVEALRRRVKTLERERTRSRRAEASLRESEARFRALFEHASDLIIAAGLDGAIISVNRATEETLQWPREALIGRNIRELITPESFARGEERMRRVLAGEKLPKIFGLEAIRRDGSVVPLEGWARLLRDAAGKPVGHEGVYRDISERRRVEEALRESEERYRLMFQEAEDARAVLDRLYRVTSAMQMSWEREDRLRAFEQGVHEALGFDRFYVALVSTDLRTLDVATAVGVEMFESLPLSPAAGPFYHVFQTRRLLAVPSDDDLRRLPPANPEYLERPYMRSRRFIITPLLAGDTVIGVASADNKTTGRPITPGHVELFNLLCQQLATALEEARLYAEARARENENARLLSELRARTGELTRSVEQLTALGEISRAVSSTLDVETVLDTIGSRATQLAGADGCAIYEYDEATQTFHVRATHNFDTAFVDTLRAMPLRKGEGVMGRATETREPVQIADITMSGVYQSQVRDALVGAGFRAVVSVPLLREEQIIGSLSLIRKASGEFSPEVIDVLKTFATQSALAIQNARLFREIEAKSRELGSLSRDMEQLYRLSTTLQEPLSLKEQLRRVLEEATRMGVLDRIYVWGVSPEGDRLVNLAGAGFAEDEWKDFENFEIPLVEAGAMYKAFREGRPLLFGDDKPLSPDLYLKPQYLLKALRTNRFLVIPMIARGQTVGVFAGANT